MHRVLELELEHINNDCTVFQQNHNNYNFQYLGIFLIQVYRTSLR